MQPETLSLNALITFVATWLIRKIPGYDKRPKQLDFLLPVVVGGIEAAAVGVMAGKTWQESLAMAGTNIMGAVSAHKLMSDSPLPYNLPKDPK